MTRPPAARSRAASLLAASLLAAVGLAGCAPVLAPESFAGREPVMDPLAFFAGPTRSRGVLEAASGAPSERFTVEGEGRTLPGGGFELIQRVAFQGKPERTRRWVLRRTGPHAYTGTLTDASGPVRAEAYGDLFHLSYPLKGVPFGAMEQWLYLQPDHTTVVNEAVVRIAGVAIRRLSERISRVNAAPAGPPPR